MKKLLSISILLVCLSIVGFSQNLHYPFDGTTNDLESGQNGTIPNPIFTYDFFGNKNSAIVFDGNDSIVVNTAFFGAGKLNFSFSGFVMIDEAYDGEHTIFNIGENVENKRAGLIVHRNGHLCYVGHSNDVQFDYIMPLHKWVHIGLVKNSLQLKLYINGELVQEAYTQIGQNVTKNKLYFGGNGNDWNGGEFLRGKLDEIVFSQLFYNDQQMKDMYLNYSHKLNQIAALYSFESNGNDSYGTNHANASSLTYTFDANGFANSAAIFDSNSDNLETPENNVIKIDSAGTISIWVNSNNWQSDQHRNMFYNNFPGSSTEHIDLIIHNSVGIHFRYGGVYTNGNVWLNSYKNYIWKPNTWHMITATWERLGAATFLKLYVDGNLENQTSTSLFFQTTTSKWSVGGSYPDVSAWDGKIDEARFLNVALDQAAISILYQKNLPLTISNLQTPAICGTQNTIQFSSSSKVDNLAIDFSQNNGANWTNLVGSIPATLLQFDWTIPAELNTDSCKLRIYNIDSATYKSEFGIFQVKDSAYKVNLVAYYPFNGNADDFSPNHFDGAINGATLTNDRFNNLSAYNFDGINDFITFANVPYQYRNFTCAFWFKTKDDNACLFPLFGAGQIEILDSVFKVVIEIPYGNFITILDTTKIADNQWHLATLCYENGSLRVYVDNRNIFSGVAYGDINYDAYVGYSIGHNTWGEPNYFDGSIDETIIFNRSLKEFEVLSMFNNTYLPNFFPNAINSIVSNQKCSVFPNPASDIIHISAPQTNEANVISIYNIMGQVELYRVLDNSAIDISKLSKGIYFVNINGKDINETHKIIVK